MSEPPNPPRWEAPSGHGKEIDGLPSQEQRRIHARLIAVGAGLDDGRMVGDIRKLLGEDATWRRRVGDYRVLFRQDIDQRVVIVVRVAHRPTAYR